MTETAPHELIDSLIKKFVSNDGDITGHVALSLFISEIFRSGWKFDRAQLVEKINKLDDSSINTIYRAAAHRIVKDNLDRRAREEINDKIIDSETYKHMRELFEEKVVNFEQNLFELSTGSSFVRQVAVAAVSSAVVAALAVLLVFAPNVIDAIRGIFGL